MKIETGWEVVCPDGNVRHFAYHNEGDAICDAEVFTERACRVYATPNTLEEKLPACPGGAHTVRPAVFATSSTTERAVA